ncbi:DUF3857 and transglutaminase domain-containing protein [Hymenobacter jejuensis]|nr:DUF3857 and transglutaminase domain-containing protein [Hymenobacter jejuensis]
MKHSLLFYLVVLLGGFMASPAAGQAPDPIKFGKIDEADLKEQGFVADSASEAVILCDYGQSRFITDHEGFKLVFDRVMRIKILKKSGYDWATRSISLYHKDSREERLANLRGFTYNLVNGQVVKEKLASTSIFKEKSTANTNIQKFTMPNVRVGSVIEFAYSITSEFLFNFQDWQFQHSIPVRWSEYRVAMPEYFDYKIQMRGYKPLDVREQSVTRTGFGVYGDMNSVAGSSSNAGTITANVTNNRWAMKNVPAFREEPYMTASENFISSIDFELAGYQFPQEGYHPVADTWNKIDKDLLADEQFGTQLKPNTFLKEQLAAALAKATDPAAKIAAVHELVRTSLKYNGSDRIYATSTLRKALDQHSGNAADVNLLFVALLRDAGFQANPVLLSTRENGWVNVSGQPLLSKFNYVVAHIALPDGKEMLADATEEFVPCGVLPTRCLNGQGHLIMPDVAQSRWVDLKPAQRFVDYRMVQLTLDERGGWTGKVHQEHGGYTGVYTREKLQKEGEKKFMEKLASNHEGWNIAKYAFTQRSALQNPLGLDYEFVSPGAEAPATTLYLNPVRHFGDDKNPFVHEDRLFPVDFGAPIDETIIININIPSGYDVDELPKALVLDLPNDGGRYMYSVQPNASSLQVTSRLSLRKAVYSAAEYGSLREFYARLIAKQAEQIVLKKKS